MKRKHLSKLRIHRIYNNVELIKVLFIIVDVFVTLTSISYAIIPWWNRNLCVLKYLPVLD